MALPLRSFAVTALAASAFAAPRPQGERGYCSPNPIGQGPVASPDTPEAFLASQYFSSAALSAGTPSGYSEVYANLNHTYEEASRFAGYIELSSYDVGACADACNDTPGCGTFTIFFERSPVINPGAACPDPASSTLIKCDLWQGAMAGDATPNYGQLQEDFHVVMAGSNAYVKGAIADVPSDFPGWTMETYLNDNAIYAPLDCFGQNTYLGVQSWADGQFNPQRCLDVCSANAECHFVNTYLQRKAGLAYSQHCALYTHHWPAQYATNNGQPRDGDDVDVTNSYSFTAEDGSYEACTPASGQSEVYVY